MAADFTRELDDRAGREHDRAPVPWQANSLVEVRHRLTSDAFPQAVRESAGRGGHGAQAGALLRAQSTCGNRAARRAVQRSATTRTVIAPGEGLLAERLEMAATKGTPLDSPVRARVEQALDADLASVRVHTDAEASRLTEQVDALAFSHGRDLYFRSRAFSPDTPQGFNVLVHEAAHVVQHDRAQVAPPLQESSLASDRDVDRGMDTTVSRSSDPSEHEAREAAARAMSGEQVRVSAAPSAGISRFGWDDVADYLGPVGRVASDTAKGVEGGGGVLDSAGSAFSHEEKTEAQMSNLVKQGEDKVSSGIDWLEGAETGAAHWLANKTAGIPVLGSLTQAGADVADVTTQVQGGILKGATGLVGGLVNMAANPIGTAKGLEAMAEHSTPIGIMNPFKTIHQGYNVLTGQESLGTAANELFNPVQQLKENEQFGEAMATGLLQPYKESWNKGKYGEVAGRAAFDIGSLVIGAGEAKGAAEVGAVSRVAEGGAIVNDVAKGADVAKVAEGTEALNGATRLGEEAVPRTLRSPGVRPAPVEPLPLEPVPAEPLPATQPRPAPGAPIEPGPATQPALPATQPRPVPGEPLPQGPATQPAPPVEPLPATQPAPGQGPLTQPSPGPVGPATEPAPVQPSSVPQPGSTPAAPPDPASLPPQQLPPGFLENPTFPRPTEAPGWAERLLQEEADLGKRIDDFEFLRELKKEYGM